MGTRSGVFSSGTTSISSADVLDVAIAQLLLRDQCGRDDDVAGDLLPRHQQGGGPHGHSADVRRVGRRGGDPRAALGGHHGDVGVRDVGAVDPDLVFETELLNGLDGTFGELVVGGEDRRDVRIGLQRGLGLLGHLGGGVVAHDTDLGDLGDARIVLLELLPHGVAAIEWGEAGHVDVDHFTLTAGVFPEHLEHRPGDVLVALVHGHDRIISGVDVEGHDRDAGLDGLCDHRLDRLREPVVDDDRVSLAVDRLLDVQRMPIAVAVGAEEVEGDPELFGLGLGTRPPLLEVVASRQQCGEADA